MLDRLEYMDTLDKVGVRVTKTSVEIPIYSPLGTYYDTLSVSPNNVEITDRLMEAEKEAIKWGIDFGGWKHSWHCEIERENYERFLDIIQKQAIEQADNLVRLNAIAVFLDNKIMSDLGKETNHA